MEQEKLITYSSVGHRVKSCLTSKNGSHPYLRGLVMGIILPVSMAQSGIYSQLKQSITLGELPWYTIDVVIIGVSTAEFVLAPLVGWLGHMRRRTTMMIYTALLAMSLLLLFSPVADVGGGTEFCNGGGVSVESGNSTQASIRLVLQVGVAMGFSLIIAGLWCHGIAYMTEHQLEGIISHFGILVAARVLGLLFMTKIAASMRMWMLVIGCTIPMIITSVQLLRVPEQPPLAEGTQKVPLEGRGFGESVSRVLSNGLAMTQILSMALLAAALWGFGWHETDMIKVLYNMEYSSNWQSMYSNVLRYHIIIFVVIYASSQFTKPVMVVFSKVSAAKLALMVGVTLVPLYIVMVTVFSCQRGAVAGLEAGNYTQPACSATCGCTPPHVEFAPVCVVDSMTTYLSPCHAGCTRNEVFGGITALSNCACGSVSGRATVGACSAPACVVPFELHKLVYIVIVIATVLVLQAQGVVLLQVVDRRDRSVALGLSTAIVALLTFVCGHLAFFAIRVYTCAWFSGGRCQLQDTLFPYLVGGLSAALALVGVIITLVAFLMLRKQQPPVARSTSEIEL